MATASSLDSSSTARMVPPPPPPPPPPPAVPEGFELPKEVVAPSETRVSLLDSIRKAGGMYGGNLKSVRFERKLPAKSGPPPGGLMAELKARKGAGRGRGGPDLMSDLKSNLTNRRMQTLAGTRAPPRLPRK